ncbi:hypothetical protein [Halomonas organivorans]|uniref:Spy/CpxP family protein refolding chaperone n=1 Tax=Halomonas organivorans TaxID=257772 RepID=A0A7W5G6T8_9GAMM|nr:hypothetical protein [Halomonas organivorans]MBB3142217.1 Spy/CpxP family protein refolding chaperone [Halomonas organivorans]
MTAALMLPSYGNSSRTDLILEVASLGLAVENALHELGPAGEARARAQFHHAMASLLALVEAEQEDDEARERVVENWSHHAQLVEEYKAELAQLEGETL